MSNGSDFTVHDLTYRQIPEVGPGAQPTFSYQFQYWVGTHGPFYLHYTQAEYNFQRLQADLNAQVEQVKQAASLQGPIFRQGPGYVPPVTQTLRRTGPQGGPVALTRETVAGASEQEVRDAYAGMGHTVLQVIDLGAVSDPSVAASLGVQPYDPSDTRHWFEVAFR